MKAILKVTANSTAVNLPRGLRNNNPLNIEKGDNWKGLRDFPTDKRFCEFQSMSYGFRAAFMILERYRVNYNLSTIDQIIRRWAPPTENDTKKYAEYVARKAGIDRQTWLPCPRMDNRPWIKIVLAMASYENGVDCRKYRKECEEGFKLTRIYTTDGVR